MRAYRNRLLQETSKTPLKTDKGQVSAAYFLYSLWNLGTFCIQKHRLASIGILTIKTVSRPSYFYNEILIPGKTVFMLGQGPAGWQPVILRTIDPFSLQWCAYVILNSLFPSRKLKLLKKSSFCILIVWGGCQEYLVSIGSVNGLQARSHYLSNCWPIALTPNGALGTYELIYIKPNSCKLLSNMVYDEYR